MAKYYYASPKFPFSKVFPLGIVLVIVGIILLCLGLVDIVYTVLKYVGTACTSTSYQGWQCPLIPCNSVKLNWTLASPGVWGGIFIMMAGSFSTSLMYASGSTIKCKRDSTGVITGLIGFPLGPMALIVCAIRIYYMNGMFFCMNQGSMKVTDYVEFLMPIMMVINIFLGWCLALAVLVALCRKGALTQRDEIDTAYGQRYPSMDTFKDDRKSYRRPFVYPAQEPSHVSAPTMWRDRSQGYQNPYMYPRSQPYFYQAPHTRGYPYSSFPRETPPRRYYTAETTYARY